MTQRHTFLLLCAGLLFAGLVQADERILSFHSNITINADASMDVVETIRVRAEGRQIQRGIYRDFPTDYRDAFGNRYRVTFEPVEVRRDGQTENWFSERRSNGTRVYAGRSDVMLTPGVYEYQIRYHTDRQLGFFTDHDELFWNVTGNGWGFPIDRAAADVTLPAGATVNRVMGFVGRVGAKEQAYSADTAGNVASFVTTRELSPGEGISVVVEWPKGVVTEPTWQQRFRYFVSDNGMALANGAVFVFALGFLVAAWWRVGRDPPAGVVFAQYDPPPGYSPASARYISRMGYDNTTFSAAILNLAVHGHCEIDQLVDDSYVLKKLPADAPVAPGEAALKAALFAKRPVVEVSNANHAVVGAARRAHKRALRRDYLGRYFKKNVGYLWPGMVVAFVVLIVTLVMLPVTLLGVLFFAATAVSHGVFAYLLKAPTMRGRLLLDHLDGFRMYLRVAEGDDLNTRHPPDKTPELFEQYLPFALALGVENDWAEQFADVFARLADDGTPYRPVWYSGAFNPQRPALFAKSVGSGFSSAIAAAATPPGSSSGSGGSSGGGGGGGGGGGW